jgi:hypothetical protein
MTKEIDLLLDVVNFRLQEAATKGTPFMARVQGSPSHMVESIDPLVMTRYGVFRNKAPTIAGQMALMAFASAEYPYGNPDTRSIYAIYAGSDGRMFAGPTQVGLLNETVSVILDVPEVEIFARA